jgi:hypothetical protein
MELQYIHSLGRLDNFSFRSFFKVDNSLFKLIKVPMLILLIDVDIDIRK